MEQSENSKAQIPELIIPEMIKLFLCPGCMLGDDGCLEFYLDRTLGFFTCSAHHPGTIGATIGRILLGLPKGFCRIGYGKVQVRLWAKTVYPHWDRFNVPVWAIERRGYLFVRAYAPRLNATYVDIVKAGRRSELCPQAIDVGEFYDEID